MALQKQITQSVPVPERFRDVTMHIHVADEHSGANAGKLVLTFIPATPVPPGKEADFQFAGFVEDIPDAVLTPTQRQKLRAHLKKCLAYWQEQAGATGTPDADPDEPAP